MALSNLPPENVDPLGERLAETYASLFERTSELEEALVRVPMVFKDDATVERATSFIKQLHAHRKAVDTARVTEKEPFLAAGRTVDSVFKRHTERMARVSAVVTDRLQTYLRAKERLERARLGEVRRLAEEAAAEARKAAERQAMALADETQLEAAIAAEEAARVAAGDAEKARHAAEAKAADLSRTRGELGGVATLRSRWTGELTDLATLDLETLREHLPTDALNQAIQKPTSRPVVANLQGHGYGRSRRQWWHDQEECHLLCTQDIFRIGGLCPSGHEIGDGPSGIPEQAGECLSGDDVRCRGG